MEKPQQPEQNSGVTRKQTMHTSSPATISSCADSRTAPHRLQRLRQLSLRPQPLQWLFTFLHEFKSTAPSCGYRTRRKWIVSAPFDHLFICGLAPWIMGATLFIATGGRLEQS